MCFAWGSYDSLLPFFSQEDLLGLLTIAGRGKEP